MHTLHIRNVPPALYRALSKTAADRESSINREAIRLLEGALKIDVAEAGSLLDEISNARRPLKTSWDSGADIIRNDRDAR